VLAAAGLLAGRPATTHHAHYDELAQIDPSVVIDAEARFVDDGDIVTSAGVSAGIDMALGFLLASFGEQAARQAPRKWSMSGTRTSGMTLSRFTKKVCNQNAPNVSGALFRYYPVFTESLAECTGVHPSHHG